MEDDYLQAEELEEDIGDWVGGDTVVTHIPSLTGLRRFLQRGDLPDVDIAIIDIMLASEEMDEVSIGETVDGDVRAGLAAITEFRKCAYYRNTPVIAFSILGWKDFPGLTEVDGPPIVRIHKTLEDDQLKSVMERLASHTRSAGTVEAE